MLKIDFNSVKTLCNNSDQVMVYGRHSCKYDEVKNVLSTHPDSPIKKVYNYWLGHIRVLPEITLEGRTFKRINYIATYNEDETIARVCKSAIINLLIENFQRHHENLPLIPLIFCIDIDGSKRILRPQDIAERDQKEKIITNSELRLCYKICCELKKDPVLAPVAEIAEKTLKFVKLEENIQSGYALKEIDPFWKDPDWNSCWNARKLSKAHPMKMGQGWREQLTEIVKNCSMSGKNELQGLNS